jgi:hypothetical protein
MKLSQLMMAGRRSCGRCSATYQRAAQHRSNCSSQRAIFPSAFLSNRCLTRQMACHWANGKSRLPQDLINARVMAV